MKNLNTELHVRLRRTAVSLATFTTTKLYAYLFALKKKQNFYISLNFCLTFLYCFNE